MMYTILQLLFIIPLLNDLCFVTWRTTNKQRVYDGQSSMSEPYTTAVII